MESEREKFGKLKVAELKVELKKVGAPLTGKKAVLLQRLLDYRRNDNFSRDVIIIPKPNPMPNWPGSGFKSLTLDDRETAPKIREEHIQQYVVFRQTLDRGANYDHAAFRRGMKMVDVVKAISLKTEDDLSFASCLVSAEMKTDLNYDTKVIIHSTGEIMNSDCECPAGEGPHATCKHVVAVCLLLAKFVGGKDLDSLKSCTELLQQFHQPKKRHRGSPVKARDMSGPKKKKKEDDDDPRHPMDKNREWNRADMLNKLTAYSFFTGVDLANRYSYGRADLVQAAADHDYLKSPFTEY